MKEKYMQEAIKEAKKAYKKNEIPIGAVIVYKNRVIAKAHNKRIQKKDVTMHAEMIAIRKACKKIKDWRLNECTIYTTVEPCVMCLGTIIEARIGRIICGVENTKYHTMVFDLCEKTNIKIEYGVKNKEIDEQLKSFFKYIRNR